MDVELSPFKKGDYKFESMLTIDRVITPLRIAQWLEYSDQDRKILDSSPNHAKLVSPSPYS